MGDMAEIVGFRVVTSQAGFSRLPKNALLIDDEVQDKSAGLCQRALVELECPPIVAPEAVFSTHPDKAERVLNDVEEAA